MLFSISLISSAVRTDLRSGSTTLLPIFARILALPLAIALGDLHLRDLSIQLLARATASGGNRVEAVGLERLRLISGEPPEEALRHHLEALPGARRREDRMAAAIHLGEAAVALVFLRRYTEAITTNEECIALFRALEDAHGEAVCLTNLGEVAYTFDLRPATLAYWRRALDLLTGEGSLEEEMARDNLERLRERWGARAFRQLQSASEPYYQRLLTGELDLGVSERAALGAAYSRVLSAATEQLTALLPKANAQD